MEVWKQKTGTGKFISILLCDDFTNEKRKRITEKEVGRLCNIDGP